MEISDFSGSHWVTGFTPMFESITDMTVNEAGILYENGEVWFIFVESVMLETYCRKRDSIKCGAIYRTSALSSESAPTRKYIRCACR